ncbi:ABCB family ABC transporter ATP-binding protein/permease [Sphingomicrobium astaxanthinifaciens]|uniref:ABCB family ABC transporter ATP-binding protein/permease n=1 Tax=Sphingomicrobium astaxanthinifaciens TaxID=1227949 RepID=UPI001FCC561F|nr:ABC transporter ATP-binding protein/permease [Sphingomicrobium astaxanthinifaciens]MCJ7421241.1 ABC transporter ATP-binding protein/permease [Sphingomicrobium astaxanthinifaciens]
MARPSKGHAPEGGDFRILLRFLPWLWPAGRTDLKARVVVSILLVLLGKAIVLAVPFFYKEVVDRMAAGEGGAAAGVDIIIGLVAAYATMRLLGTLVDNVRNGIFERVGQEAARRLASRLFRHIHALSLRFHLERRTGSLGRLVERGTKSVDSMLYFILFNIAPTAVELVGIAIIFTLQFGLGLTAATMTMVVAYIWFTRVVTDWRNAIRRDMNAVDQQAAQRAVDSLLNYETVKYFGAEERESARYDSAVERYSHAAVKNETSLAWLNAGQAVITNVMMAGAMAYTVWGWSAGRFTPGDVVLVNSLLMQLYRPLNMLGWVYRSIKQGLIDMEEMFALLDTPVEIEDAAGARDLHVGAGHVRFEAVRFGYGPDREILKGIDLDIPAGTSLAVVGPSGAGKSTLARLLYRFYEPQGGRITIDGVDIAEVTQASLRAAIGIVPQDAVLFNDTIGYNIGYGREDATQPEVEAAAKGAAIDAFIAALPEGYDTKVGERGLKLSGGEKQRVAIARTLLKDPPILILDEATSALDSATEQDIQATLEDVMRARTTIMIAHRLSTVVHADQIVVLDDGQVAERGTHEELLALGGRYADLWARQARERALEKAAE